MVGSAIVCDLKSKGYTNIITRTSSELNLINQLEVIDFFEQERPEYVFLAAAKANKIDDKPANSGTDNTLHRYKGRDKRHR